MSVLKKVAVGMGGNALVGAVGNVVSGAYGIVSKTGQAIGVAGKALGSAAQDASKKSDTPSNNVIIANTGMAGSAGKQKVTGGGTLPAPKAVAKPQVSIKMPTEELLNTAVKYLSSIDRSLKAQLDFEKNSYQEQARAEREAIIENKPSTTFNDMKDRLSGLKSDTKDSASIAGTILKYAAILGGAAALIASALDQKQLDALKENVEEFKKKFNWLGDLGAMVGAGGILGFLFPGKGGKGLKGRLKGGLRGMIAAHIADRLYSTFVDGYKKDENGNVVIDPKTGEPIKESRSMSAAGYGLSLVAGGMAVGSIAKRLPAAKLAGQTAGQLSRAAGASSIAGMQAATKKGTSWLATRRGRKFLIILGRKLGKGVVAKLGLYLARIVAGLLATTTGVGAVPGIIIILGSIASIGLDLFDVATSIYDAFNESGTDNATATAVPARNKEQDAIKVAGTATGSNAQIGQNQAILATIRMKESGNNYNPPPNPASTASGAYQFLDGTWQALSKKYGIGTEYSRAKDAPPEIQDAVADRYVSDILNEAGGDISKVPVAWYTGNIRGDSKAATPEQVAAYQADWLKVYNGGKPDYKAATNSSYNSSTPSISGMVNSGAEQVGKIFGMLGSSIIKPGVARNFTPSGSNISEQISANSMKLQNDITFGIQREKSKDKITSPTIPAGTPRGVRPAKSVSYIDPNYQNINVLHKYLAHFRMAS
jgi:hypothetical protein